MDIKVDLTLRASQLQYEAKRQIKRNYGKRYRIKDGALPEPRTKSKLPSSPYDMVQKHRGTLRNTGDGYILSYDETDGDMAGSAVTLRFSPSKKSLYMQRRGAYTANMIFTAGKKSHSLYSTAVAPLRISVYTKAVSNTVNEKGKGIISVSYKTRINSSVCQYNRLVIEVRPQ